LVAPVVYLDAKAEADLARYKGKLKGAIVLTTPARNLAARFEPLASRLSDHDLLELADAAEPVRRGSGRPTSPSSPGDGERSANPTVAASGGAGNGGGNGGGTAAEPASGSSTNEPAQSGAGAGPGPGPGGPRGRGPSPFTRRKLRFLVEEGAAVLIDP